MILQFGRVLKVLPVLFKKSSASYYQFAFPCLWFKATVQFETDWNEQNEIISHLDRSIENL